MTSRLSRSCKFNRHSKDKICMAASSDPFSKMHAMLAGVFTYLEDILSGRRLAVQVR